MMYGDPFDSIKNIVDELSQCPVFSAIQLAVANHYANNGGPMYVLITRDCFKSLIEELKPHGRAPTLEIGGAITITIYKGAYANSEMLHADLIVTPKQTFLFISGIVAYEFIVVGNPGHEILYGKEPE